MAIDYSLYNTPNFNPYTFDELTKPLDKYKEYYDANEEAISALDTELGAIESQLRNTGDTEARKQLQNYRSALEYQRDKLYKYGLDTTTRQGIKNLKSEYSRMVTPVMTALTTRKAQADAQQKALAADNTVRFSRDAMTTDLDQYLANQDLTFDTLSGKEITARAASMAGQLKDQVLQDRKLKSLLSSKVPGLNGRTTYWELIQQKGVDPMELMEYARKNGDRKTMSGIQKMLDDISTNVMNEFSHNAAWNDDWGRSYINEGLMNAIGKTETKQFEDPDINNYWKNRQMDLQEEELEWRKGQTGATGGTGGAGKIMNPAGAIVNNLYEHYSGPVDKANDANALTALVKANATDADIAYYAWKAAEKALKNGVIGHDEVKKYKDRYDKLKTLATKANHVGLVGAPRVYDKARNMEGSDDEGILSVLSDAFGDIYKDKKGNVITPGWMNSAAETFNSVWKDKDMVDNLYNSNVVYLPKVNSDDNSTRNVATQLKNNWSDKNFTELKSDFSETDNLILDNLGTKPTEMKNIRYGLAPTLYGDKIIIAFTDNNGNDRFIIPTDTGEQWLPSELNSNSLYMTTGKDSSSAKEIRTEKRRNLQSMRWSGIDGKRLNSNEYRSYRDNATPFLDDMLLYLLQQTTHRAKNAGDNI